MRSKSYACPRCGRQVLANDPHFPFCGRRCRLIDLGRWLEGDFRFAGQSVTLPDNDHTEGDREQ